MGEKNNSDNKIDESNISQDSESNNDFSVSNIFEDFENDSELVDDIDKKQHEVEKDLYYYLGVASGLIKYINIFLVIILMIAYYYLSVQNSDKKSEVLNPVCSVLLGTDINYNEIPYSGTGASNTKSCSSIKEATKNYEDSIKNEQDKYYNKLLAFAIDYYSMSDFINSKEVVFLLYASENKKNPFEMLNLFDQAKNKFLGKDKLKIQCSSISITDTTFSASCEAYSSAWDKTIPGYDGSKSSNNLKGGTSISVASSFLNFLERQEGIELISKQKSFKINSVSLDGAYSYKTPFTVEIEKKDLNIK